MNKSILVIDTPKSCKECPLMFEDNDEQQWCGYERTGKNELHMRVHYYVGDRTKPNWCQLKKLPRKRGNITLTERTQDIGMLKWALETKLVNKGYNECRDDILGEEE